MAGDPTIGGRYSVLSAFGSVPASVMGLDMHAFYEATAPMVFSCGGDSPPKVNPGFQLGAVIGEAAVAGRDKLTVLPSKGLEPFGAWLEQLLAESTGKQGRGIVPVDLEPPGDPGVYGDDRLFAHLHLEGDYDEGLEAKLKALVEAGQPVVYIHVAKPELVGQEFLRWEEVQDRKWEFDGFRPVAVVGVTAAHDTVQVNTIVALGTRLRGTPCRPSGADMMVDVGSGRYRYPDATVSCTPHDPKARRLSEPVVIFEVLSESTARLDKTTKLIEYRSIPTVRRYVMLEQDQVLATVVSRTEAAWALEVLRAGEVLVMPEVGIGVPMEEFYAGLYLPSEPAAPAAIP